MKVLVTSKGQVTIPKELRDRFDIHPGTQMDFAAAEDGIRVRKIVDRRKSSKVLGCLKAELENRTVSELLDELRGAVEFPRHTEDGQ